LKISLIVAVSANNVIGVDGGLPWRLSEDLKRFKATTMGKPMIMGRATFDSIGKALPGRRCIVMSRQAEFRAEGCDVVSSLDQALAHTCDAEEVMVIGGSKIYALFLPMAERIYLTRVHVSIQGDTFFPDLEPAEWGVIESQEFTACDERALSYAFEIWERFV
jgi:dihydrofolate reductase